MLLSCWTSMAIAQDNRDRDSGDPFGDYSMDAQARFAPPGQRPPTTFRLGIQSRNTPTGVLVVAVQPGSIAQQSGIEPNDTIITVGGYQVGIVNGRTYDIAEELARRVDGQGRVNLLVQNRRNSQLLNVPVQFFGTSPGFGIFVTGNVNTGNRNLVAPGMVLEVRLIDVSQPNWQTVTIAETQVPVQGLWPIPYQLDIDPSRIRPNHRYSVTASITSRGMPVLSANSPVPVNLASGNSVANLTLIPSRNPNPGFPGTVNPGPINPGIPGTVNPGIPFPNNGPPIDQIQGWYQQLLGRNLTDREQTVWQRELSKGKSLDEILATVLCSSEYFDQYRGNIDQYINSLFEILYGRGANPNEIRALRNQMSQSAELRLPAVLSLVRQRNR